MEMRRKTIKLREKLQRDGFVVIRELLDKNTTDKLRKQISEVSEIHDADFVGIEKGTKRLWTMPNGVAKRKEFQHIIWDPHITNAVKEVLGENISYLHHNDLHAGYGSPGWHRDSVNRVFPEGSDFDETGHPYRVVRVAIYLQSHAESGFKMGFIPKSHRREKRITKWERKAPRVSTVRRWLIGQKLLTAKSKWVATNPGDVVIFDCRTLHCGGHIRGPKYAVYMGYGIQNHHFDQHWNYYEHIRKDLGYGEVEPSLQKKLEEMNLWPKKQIKKVDEIGHAYIPKLDILDKETM